MLRKLSMASYFFILNVNTIIMKRIEGERPTSLLQWKTTTLCGSRNQKLAVSKNRKRGVQSDMWS